MVLIVGGMGFIGLHCARRFLDAGEDVVLTHYRVRREPDFLRPHLGSRALVERLDVADGEQTLDVLRRHRVDGILHLAVPALRGEEPAAELTTNMLGLRNLLEGGRLVGVRRITVASSIAVYHGVPEAPWHEGLSLPVESQNPTEAYKKAIEILGLHFGRRTGTEVVMVRLAGIFGPLYHTMANLPSRLCHAAAARVAPDLGGVRGGPPRASDANDWCYVEDAAAGIQAVHSAPTLRHAIYNVGGGRATTVAELVQAVRGAAPEAPAPRLEPDGPASPSPAACYMDLGRIRSELGFEPRIGVEEGVARYVDWLRSHPQ
jgi:UDP-glucose 4-epimerase